MMRMLLIFYLTLASLMKNGVAFVNPTTTRCVNFAGSTKGIDTAAAPPLNRGGPVLRLANRDDDKNVNVNLLPDIDAFTLTSIGFGLIAFNFFVLANMGDAGLAGIIARIINTFS
mmetsp:Transcript_35727/g.86234  ORF Transcript_35727/g.86234 Transcript_35727/m.86234 type:complete len:115 (+) Transcript_35727:112-456(+)